MAVQTIVVTIKTKSSSEFQKLFETTTQEKQMKNFRLPAESYGCRIYLERILIKLKLNIQEFVMTILYLVSFAIIPHSKL